MPLAQRQDRSPEGSLIRLIMEETFTAAEDAALYADPQPAVFVPRISGTITNVVGESQVFVDDTGEVFAVDETGSPEHTLKQKQAQADARKAIIATAKTAKGKGNKLSDIAERVAALEALNGIK